MTRGGVIGGIVSMIYGLHLSGQGARAQSSRLDVIANNLANASTTAFKRSFAVFQDHKPYDVEHGLQKPTPHDLNESTGGIEYASGDSANRRINLEFIVLIN